MKTTHSISTTLSVTLLLASVGASRAHADWVTVPSHAVRANGAQIFDAVPGSGPSPGHPEGTVFGIVFSATGGTFLAEVDVAQGTSLRRADVSCQAILHEGNRVYGACGRELIALDAATLAVLWRTATSICPADSGWSPVHLASNGNDRVVVSYECTGTLALRVANPSTGALLGGVDTGIQVESRGLVRIFFHGTTILAASSSLMGYKSDVAVLAPRYDRVAHRLALGMHQGVWDDGTHLHASGTPPRKSDTWVEEGEKGKVVYQPPQGPAWLVPDRDYLLSDTLAPLRWTKLAPEVPETQYKPEHAGGEYVDYHLKVGQEHFWITRSCCGGDAAGAGLYAGKEE